MTIKNDQEFKQALEKLSIADQRLVSAQFVESVLYLNNEPLIKRALEIVNNKNHTSIEFDDAYKNVKSLAVKTYTNCGENADWSAQAAHFVTEAAKACLTPEEHLETIQNLAWQCAIQSRMAKNCAMIESEQDVIDNEAKKQYAIVDAFIS